MTFWWLADSVRLGIEKEAVEALWREGPWFVLQRWMLFEFCVAAEGVICAHGHEYPVRLMYPDQFPQVPAWVEPQDTTAKWSGHQYGAGGTLCLELRPDNWVETATGADVLMSARNLLEIENPLGQESERRIAPSAHNVGRVQSYDWLLNPLLVSAGCMARLRTGEAVDVRAFHSALLDGTVPIVVHDAVDRADVRRPPGDGALGEVPVFVTSADLPVETPTTRQDLLVTANFAGDTVERVVAAPLALVLFVNALASCAFHVFGEGAPLRRELVILPDSTGLRSARPAEATRKRVAVVGAGSVGSKVAESLVRSGVTRVTLIDGDILLPANLERHVLDWRDVGFRKVNALKRRLLHIAPGVDVDVVAQNLNWQRSARTHAGQADAIGACDVIVDATGDVPTALFLGAVAAANGRPFVSVEVFEGGIGALVASCLPGRDPPYVAARAAFLAWCEAQGAAVPKGAGRPYESLVDEGPPLVADDAAVTMAAAHGARVMLDIIDGKPAAREAAWLLVGFQKAWVFDGHGHTIRLSVGVPVDRSGESENVEARAFALSLLQEAQRARPPSE